MAPLLNTAHLFAGSPAYGALNILNQPVYPGAQFSPLLPSTEVIDRHVQWMETLNPDERVIVETATALYNTLTLAGTCYHSSFFLHYYLKYRCGIKGGHVEVGFVNDGMDAGYGSHAWYVYEDKITDLALCRPLDARNNWKGPLTILGREMLPGWQWSYHTEDSPEGFQAVKNLFTLPSANPYDVVTAAKQLHVHMSDISQSDEAIRAYLDAAPHGLTYRDLAKKIAPSRFAAAA